jgi:LCP family protein required for cell wall assembly
MHLRSVLRVGILLPLLLACQLFSGPGLSESALLGTSVARTLTAIANTGAPGPARTSTPSGAAGALTATAEPLPSQGPTTTPMPFSSETPPPPGGIPPQAAPISLPAGEVTLLLMGSDQRPGQEDFRTDTLLLVVLKTDGSVSLVSFPRDLWVYLPSQSMERINSAMEYGGFQLVQSTFQYNFGFAPQSYILTTFHGFQSIIDDLGGIDVQVGQTLSDTRTGFPKGFTVYPGWVHMDAATALWYVRSRESTSDLDRLRRAQEVIIAIGRKLFSLNGLSRLPQVYSDYRGDVVTDLTLQDVLNLAPIFQSVITSTVQRFVIGEGQVTPFITSEGADVLLPQSAAIRQLLLQALGN